MRKYIHNQKIYVDCQTHECINKESPRNFLGGEMDVREVLASLRVEREQLITVIENLERLAVSRESRRGRPPAIMSIAKKRGRPKVSRNKRSLVREQKAMVSAAAAGGVPNPLSA